MGRAKGRWLGGVRGGSILDKRAGVDDMDDMDGVDGVDRERLENVVCGVWHWIWEDANAWDQWDGWDGWDGWDKWDQWDGWDGWDAWDAWDGWDL